MLYSDVKTVIVLLLGATSALLVGPLAYWTLAALVAVTPAVPIVAGGIMATVALSCPKTTG